MQKEDILYRSILCLTGLLVSLMGSALAQVSGNSAHSTYPNRPIRLLMPFPAGGTPDALGRTLASQVESQLGLPGTLAVHEKTIIKDALRACGGRVFGPSGAAARLGIPRSTLESKIRALKINKRPFRTRTAKRS